MAPSYDNLDDAANAALYMLGLTQDRKREHIGAIYGDDMQRTEAVSGGRSQVHGSLKIPAGTLDALFHNHPPDDSRGVFSDTDKDQARQLNVPSYISAGDRALKRFDPATGKTSDVLAQFPMDEFRAYLMQKLLGRASDDSRGLYE